MVDVDLSMYYPIPMLSTDGYISLGETLISVAPTDPPPYVATAIDGLAKVVSETQQGLVARLDEDRSTGLEQAFDLFVDRVWNQLYTELEFTSIYRHPGTAYFEPADLQKLDFEERLEEAGVGARMLERMFAGGTDWLRSGYPQQATQMAARLNWISEKQLDAPLEQLVGERLVNLVHTCQVRYQAMVAARGSRASNSQTNLRAIRDRLRRQVYGYCGVIGGLLDPDDPHSHEVVERALRPILIARANMRRGSTGFGDEADVDATQGDGIEPADVDVPVEDQADSIAD